MFIKRSALFSIATRECGVANFLLATTTNELRRAQEHASVMSKDAKCRLATFLTDFWKRMGKPNCLDFPMTHQDIADHPRVAGDHPREPRPRRVDHPREPELPRQRLTKARSPAVSVSSLLLPVFVRLHLGNY